MFSIQYPKPSLHNIKSRFKQTISVKIHSSIHELNTFELFFYRSTLTQLKASVIVVKGWNFRFLIRRRRKSSILYSGVASAGRASFRGGNRKLTERNVLRPRRRQLEWDRAGGRERESLRWFMRVLELEQYP